ncbi:MAG TPA: hypothetical protein VMU09_02860 [Acidimicrobiales bacterium]|nr:hypothetical protein [Acidimicrobiales bacterium]
MSRQLRAEVLKLRSLWSTWILVGSSAAAAVFLGGLIAVLPRNAASGTAALPSPGTAKWFDLVFLSLSYAEYFALVIGVLAVTGEYRHRTITSTYLVEPRRTRVAGSKTVVAAGYGGLCALAAAGAGLLLGLVLVWAGKGTTSLMLTEYRHVAPGVLGASMVFGVFGVGLGVLLRSQVVALVVGLGTAIVESSVAALLPSGIGRWLPSQAAQAMSSATAGAAGGLENHVTHLLPWWGGGLLLLGYGLALVVIGSATTLRADVT